MKSLRFGVAVALLTAVGCSGSSHPTASTRSTTTTGATSVTNTPTTAATPTTSVTSARYAARYQALFDPLKKAIEGLEQGSVNADLPPAARTRAITAVSAFNAAAPKVQWPEPSRTDVKAMMRAGAALVAFLEHEYPTDPRQVLQFRIGLAKVTAPAIAADERIRADLGLSLPSPA